VTVNGEQPDRRTAGVTAGALAVPLLVLFVRVARSSWLSFLDWASIELRTRDVGTLHTPLVGPFSRYGWNHPGPLLFYVLAVPYRMLGAQGRGILAGALVVNAASLACIATVLWRRGRAAGLALGLAIVLLLARALGASFLINPWNPYVIVLPLFAVVCLSWAAADGDLWALPAAIGVGSFAVQSHVGTTLAVFAPIAVAVVVLVLEARRQGFARLARVSLGALAVTIMCWSAPFVQQFQPGGGNLGDLVRFWMQSHPSTTGWSTGARIVLQQLSIPAPWFTGHEKVNAFSGGVDAHWHVPVALFLLIGAAAVAARRRDRQSFILDTLALAVVLAAFFSAARIVDAPYDYIVRWMWIVGAIVWLAIIWTVWRALPGDHLRWDRAATRSGAAVSAVLLAWLVVGAVHADFPVQSYERSLVRMAPAARRALRALPGPVLVEYPHDFHSAEVAPGLLLVAIHAGVDARLSEGQANVVGTAHTISAASARSVVVVAVDDAIDAYRNNPTYRSIARYDPLSAEERAYRDAVYADIRRAGSRGFVGLKRWAAAHPRQQSRLQELNARGMRIELFLQTP
jgi:hypothetical protein